MARLFGTNASDGLATELLGNLKHFYRAGIGLDVRALGHELRGTQAWECPEELGTS